MTQATKNKLSQRAFGKWDAKGIKYETCRAYNRRWRKNNPEKRRAHLRVLRAIRRGLLNKLPCHIRRCKNKDVHAHHKYGYADSLNVVWYCAKHHRQKHAQER